VHATLGTTIPGIAGSGFGFVVFGTVAFSIVICLLLLLTRGHDSLYDQIGAGGLSRESDAAGSFLAAPEESEAARAEREQEIRQMLGARSERMVRRGEPALDIDAEVARLLAPVPGTSVQDAGLAEEVRQLVIARNERRLRRGEEALDVDTEVARTLAELDP